MTAEYRSAEMELPTSLKIGASYDILFGSLNQYLTFAFAFTSNAFLKDNYALGMEYGLLFTASDITCLVFVILLS